MPAVERRPQVCVSVHDVAPETWPACRRLLELIDSFGHVPVTLLVVPEYHRHGRIDRAPDFIAGVEKRLARGDEVALHGYYHLDEAPAPKTALDWVQRRVLTRAEGEFAALAFEPARKRLQLGLSLMSSLGWPVRGFVAPAWLLGPAAREALSRFNLAYTTTRLGLYRLPSWEFTRAPSLVYSVGAGWRHAMSEAANRLMYPFAGGHGLLRLSLHPVDASRERPMRHWKRMLDRALASYEPVTKSVWAMGEAAHLRGPNELAA
jgi:predicted deacetylase